MAASASAPELSRTETENDPGTYTVVSGDTLWDIAIRYNIDGGWQALAAANSDIINDPDLIFPGQILTIPND